MRERNGIPCIVQSIRPAPNSSWRVEYFDGSLIFFDYHCVKERWEYDVDCEGYRMWSTRRRWLQCFEEFEAFAEKAWRRHSRRELEA